MVDKVVAIATNDLVPKLCEVGAMRIVRGESSRIEVGCEVGDALDLVSNTHETGLALLDEAHVRTGNAGASLRIDAAKPRLILGQSDENVASRLFMYLRLPIEEFGVTQAAPHAHPANRRGSTCESFPAAHGGLVAPEGSTAATWHA